MNRATLRVLFEANEVPRDQYGLSGGLPNECFCIDLDPEGKWCTYYSERGVRSGLKLFDSEDAACKSLAVSVLPNIDLNRLE